EPEIFSPLSMYLSVRDRVYHRRFLEGLEEKAVKEGGNAFGICLVSSSSSMGRACMHRLS
ncbi:hypothetical protein CSUI_011347, partial [Cystoisospora suis]